MGPNFAYCSFCPSQNLFWECLPKTLLCSVNGSDMANASFHFSHTKEETNVQKYNTPKRNHIVKTRLDDEEYADFLHRLEIYSMNQLEFIRQAISGATIKPTIVATLVSEDLITAIGKLTAEYGRIGNNLNQIARHLNEWHSPYPTMAKELRDATVDLAILNFEVMKKVGDAVGNVQAYQL